MDAGQHHLLIAVCRQSADFLEDVFHAPAADPPSGIRDDTVAAELVASVLDLHVGPGMPGRTAQAQALIFFFMGQVPDMSRGMLFLPGPQDLRKVLLLIVSNQDIHRAVLKKLLSGRLHVAAGRRHHRVRVHLLCPVQHLPGFAVRNIGHAAGIDDIQVGFFPEGNDLISVFFQDFLHGLRLICVYFTAQVVQRSFFHSSPPFFMAYLSRESLFPLTFSPQIL